MLERRVCGNVPKKHHIAFLNPKGALYYEECVTRDGFDGPYSIVYHEHRPHTQRLGKTTHGWKMPQGGGELSLAKRHFRSQELSHEAACWLDARRPLLFNDDVVLGVAFPSIADPTYFSNGDADDLFYVFKGSGVVRSMYGDLRYKPDDYVCVPRGTLHRVIPDPGIEHFVVAMEFLGGMDLLKQWRNPSGQLRMDAPYCHRDFRGPEFVGPLDEGILTLTVKKNGAFHGFELMTPPLDVVGWDGAVYPWAFSILDFQPRAGLVHLPPTWHGTFGARGAVVCSFVLRVLDFHPEAIPCPYPHSSVDCDEFIFYCRGNFISRKGVGPGSISHHPAGIPHGPHPGSYEKSRGHKVTEELAVMLDTYKPLRPTALALSVEDTAYQDSFLDR